MNSRLLFLPAILAATAAFGASADALSSSLDAHARAAALLSGVHIESGAKTTVNTTPSAGALDAHAQAAELLSASQVTARNSPTSEISETLGQHPAVLVARTSGTRGIDPNTFIVAHPARLALLAASETDKDLVARVEAQGAAMLAEARTGDDEDESDRD